MILFNINRVSKRFLCFLTVLSDSDGLRKLCGPKGYEPTGEHIFNHVCSSIKHTVVFVICQIFLEYKHFFLKYFIIPMCFFVPQAFA